MSLNDLAREVEASKQAPPKGLIKQAPKELSDMPMDAVKALYGLIKLLVALVLFLIGIGTIYWGATEYNHAKTVMQQIAGIGMILVGVVIVSTLAIIDRLRLIAKLIEQQNKRR